MDKREKIAAKIMAELVARCDNASAEQLASDATNYADALIAHLKRTQTTEDSSAVEADKDEWIPHTPGYPMPCEEGSMIRIRFRNGKKATTPWPELMMGWDEIPPCPAFEIIAWKPAEGIAWKRIH